jgi:putative phosphoesterase
MRIGLLSDIHGNAHALKSVLKSAREKGVDKILCCGDYVGYYYEPDEVMFLLNDWDWVGISGNHEAMLLDWLNGKNQNDIMAKFGSGISTAAEKLSHKTASYLYEMPSLKKLNISSKKVILCHGSPWDRDVYIYPDASQDIVNKMFEYDPDFDVLIYGHTHYPLIWEKNKKKIINPGSVGQPRDRKPGASWALWETDTQNITFFREKYDPGPVIELCRQYDPDIKYLAEVLVRE